MSKMLEKLKKFLSPQHQSGLEAFLESKCITSAADIEYWARYYDQHKGDVVWMRGL